MRELKLTNSDLVVIVDNEDYEWASQLELFLQEGKKASVVRIPDPIRSKHKALAREIAKRVVGEEYFDDQTYVYHQNRDITDVRRSNLFIKKFLNKEFKLHDPKLNNTNE